MANKEERTRYAKQLIIANPSWGKDRINEAVRGRYGTGLRRIDVARLKDVTLIGRLKTQTGRKPLAQLVREAILEPATAARRVITVGFDEAYHQLRAAGFVNSEIRHFFSTGNAPTLFNTAPYRAMLKTRRGWFRNLQKKGLSKQAITDEILRYYSKVGRSPFDFLRKEYRPPLRIDYHAYREAARRRAWGRTSALYRKR